MYTVVHIQGADGLWNDLLPRWVHVPASYPVDFPATVCAAHLFDGAPADMPSRSAIRDCENEAAGASGKVSTSAGNAVQETDGLFRVTVVGRRVLGF